MRQLAFHILLSACASIMLSDALAIRGSHLIFWVGELNNTCPAKCCQGLAQFYLNIRQSPSPFDSGGIISRPI
jgi:hypothetical protein